jgi:hypothetical protein
MPHSISGSRQLEVVVFWDCFGMSALGQEWSWAYVRFAPKADITGLLIISLVPQRACSDWDRPFRQIRTGPDVEPAQTGSVIRSFAIHKRFFILSKGLIYFRLLASFRESQTGNEHFRTTTGVGAG